MPFEDATESELRALLAQAVSESRSVAKAAAELPDLDPGLLMSSEARQEVLAASFSIGQPLLSSMVMGTGSNEEEDPILGLITSIAADAETPDHFDVDFDVETLEGTAAPNERVRFQIGRQSPPRDYFSSQSQSQDGSVVGRMGARGRFESTLPATRPVSVPIASTTPAARPAPTATPVSKYTLLKSDPFK